MVAPKTPHWDVVMHIVRFLKNAPERCLLSQDHNYLEVNGYIGADWTWSVMDRRSTTRGCIYFGANLISWKNRKQHVI